MFDCSLRTSVLALTTLLLLTTSACVAEGGLSAGEQDSRCAATSAFLQEECLAGEGNDGPSCYPQSARDMLLFACPGQSDEERDAQLCALGLATYCPTQEESEEAEDSEEGPQGFAKCSQYVDINGIEACEFYRCREKQIEEEFRCGSEGYYIGYGLKYCTRFQETAAESLSEEGIAWVNRVMPCLMNAVEDEVDSLESCEGTFEIAMDSHPLCYVQTGFCNLGIDDFGSIFLTIDHEDFQLQQALVAGVSCLAQWATD